MMPWRAPAYSAAMHALQIHAGPRALRLLQQRPLQPDDVALIPGAAGGPKGLVLGPLDRLLFGQWLPRSQQVVHLLGASIGAWRMAVGCLADPVAGFDELADSYINQHYDHEPGKAPTARLVSEVFGAELTRQLGPHVPQILAHPRYRLHVFTSRGRMLLGREGRWRTPLGYFGAFATNVMSRRAMGHWLERVVFSDPRSPLPLRLHDYRSHRVPLDAANFHPALLASCSIPFWLDAVHDIPGGPRGAYWDGGITDYHLHLDYASLAPTADAPASLVLYPHFQAQVVPGWLDKGLRHRHRASAALDNLVLLSPNPAWVSRLPGGKLPDRTDFKRFGDDVPARRVAWRRAVDESERLAEEFSDWVEGRSRPELLPLR
jgi:hypothetical protein